MATSAPAPADVMLQGALQNTSHFRYHQFHIWSQIFMLPEKFKCYLALAWHAQFGVTGNFVQ
jgi:hypothetical protein